jgi:putative sigma-54 modulation protein
MSFNLTGKNSFQITPAIRERVEEKFQKLVARYAQMTNIHVVLHIENLDHIAEATLHYHGHDVHATAASADMYAAIDQLEDKIANQLHKLKEKIIDSHH